MAYLAILEKPDAVRVLFVGNGTAAYREFFERAGLVCAERPGGRYDIVFLAGTDADWKDADASVAENGIVVRAVDVRNMKAGDLWRILKGAPNESAHLWMPGEEDWLIVARPEPRNVRAEAMMDVFLREACFADLTAAKCDTLTRFFASYVGTLAEILPAFNDNYAAVVKPGDFVSRAIPPTDWIDWTGVDEAVLRTIRAEMRSFQNVRRTVLEGNLLAESRKADEAVEAWARAAKRNPDDPFLLERVEKLKTNAQAFIKVNNFPMAMKCYETIVVIYPDDAAAVFNLGLCLKKMGRMELADEVLTRAREIRARMARESLPSDGEK